VNLAVPTLEEVLAEQARRSLAEFVRQAWHVFEPGTPLKWSWVLDAICEHVQALLEDRLVKDGRVIRNLVINVPPGTSKSTITSVCLPAWQWVRNPAWRGLFASGNENVAIRDSIKCRSLLDSDWYRNTFKPTWRFSKDQNAKTLYQNSSTGFRQAISAGAIVVGQRADDLFVDDPNGTNEGSADRVQVMTWWDNAMWNRLNDLSTGHRVIIQQRVHEEDLTGHVQGKDPDDWAFLVIRMEYEAPTEKDPGPEPTPGLNWLDPRTIEGELMFPERFPPVVVEAQKKVLGSAGSAGQLQQRPAPKDGLIFKAGFVRFYKTGAEPEFARKFLSADTAFSKERTADFSVIAAAGECEIPGMMGLWLIDLWREQVGFPELKAQAKLMAAKHNPDTFLVEDKASGQSLIQELERDTDLPVVKVKVDVDKVTRANAAAPTWEAGRIWIPEDAPWAADFLAELYAFPRGKNDDQVDVLTQLIKYAIIGGSPGDGILGYIRELKAAKEKQ
jgi:predicted phage terminase large subunit-like protein